MLGSYTPMPNSPTTYYREVVIDGVVKKIKYMTMNIYDNEKRGGTTEK